MKVVLAICTFIGLCFVASFFLKVLGKAVCWVVGATLALAGAAVLGSVALIGMLLLIALASCVFALFA